MDHRNKCFLGLTLTDWEFEIIDRINARLSSNAKYSLTITNLVENWSKLIEEIRSGYGYSVFDYTNDLSSREIIDDLLPELPSRVESELIKYLTPLDEQFREMTELPASNLNHSLLPGQQRDKWYRIPKEPKGDLLQFLESTRKDKLTKPRIPPDTSTGADL